MDNSTLFYYLLSLYTTVTEQGKNCTDIWLNCFHVSFGADWTISLLSLDDSASESRAINTEKQGPKCSWKPTVDCLDPGSHHGHVASVWMNEALLQRHKGRLWCSSLSWIGRGWTLNKTCLQEVGLSCPCWRYPFHHSVWAWSISPCPPRSKLEKFISKNQNTMGKK